MTHKNLTTVGGLIVTAIALALLAPPATAGFSVSSTYVSVAEVELITGVINTETVSFTASGTYASLIWWGVKASGASVSFTASAGARQATCSWGAFADPTCPVDGFFPLIDGERVTITASISGSTSLGTPLYGNLEFFG